MALSWANDATFPETRDLRHHTIHVPTEWRGGVHAQDIFRTKSRRKVWRVVTVSIKHQIHLDVVLLSSICYSCCDYPGLYGVQILHDRDPLWCQIIQHMMFKMFKRLKLHISLNILWSFLQHSVQNIFMFTRVFRIWRSIKDKSSSGYDNVNSIILRNLYFPLINRCS